MKTYELYTSGPGGWITTDSGVYGRGGYPWIAMVRANSEAEARKLLLNQVLYMRGKIGVKSLDISSGPPKVWPWDLDRDVVASQWSKS